MFPRLLERDRYQERDRVVARARAAKAGLVSPERRAYHDLGNKELPVYKDKRRIEAVIRDNQISMLDGATGSGKSTQLGQYALEMGYKKVVYLEPRVLLADNLSARIAEELSGQLGEGIGDSLVGVRHSERSTGYGKTIEVMTSGTFMRVMHELEQYADEPVLIIGDEIHEKDFETELAVAAAARQLPNKAKWRMCLVSATLDSASIRDAYTEMNGAEIPLVSVEGRPHNLEIIEEPELTAAEAFEKYGPAHKKALIFTAGKREINDTIGAIRRRNPGNVRLDRLHAKLSRADIRRATHSHIPDGTRQGIVSTSAGQSGITIPELTLVISDGTTRRPELNEDGVPGLFKQQCTQDELVQQGGRAGRDVGGGVVVYVKPDDPSFSYVPFAEREKQSPAQVYHTNIARSVLLSASFDADFYELNKFLVHKVSFRSILEAYEVLHRLQAVDDKNKITEIGMLMNQFPVRPELSRALTEALTHGASNEVVQHLVGMICAVEAGGLPMHQKGLATKWREDIRRETRDDYTAELDMFYATRQFYLGTSVDEKALQAKNYDLKNVYRAHRTFDKIMHTLHLPFMDVDTTPPTDETIDELQSYLTAGLFDFAHKRVGGARKPTYVSLHDTYGDDQRELSESRGTYKAADLLVIGMPRRFEKYEKGELVEHSVIENVMPTTAALLGRYAARLTERRTVSAPKIVGGRLVRAESEFFGSLLVGETVAASPLEHSPETRALLADAAFKKPTQTIQELVQIKSHLESRARLVPPEEYVQYFPDGLLTDEWLRKFVDSAISNDTEDIYTLDNNLRTKVVHGDLSLRKWLSEEHEYELMERSPDTIVLGDSHYILQYTLGRPTLLHFHESDADNLPSDGLFLPDGREVLISYRLGNDTKRYRASELKQLLKARQH